jgi:RNA polymerase sigma-70 factor (ECF subfamily)
VLNALRQAPFIESSEMSNDETALVAMAKDDRLCFGLLYDRYLTLIYRYCYARLGSKEAAEDAASQIFTRAIDALHTCRNESFRSWLFAIAHNVVTDSHRSARPSLPLEVAERTLDPAPSPDVVAGQNDEDRFVRRLIAQLTATQRDVVELRMAGLTGPEIARALGRSHGAVRIAQFRAYSRLRDLFREQNPSLAGEIDHEA